MNLELEILPRVRQTIPKSKSVVVIPAMLTPLKKQIKDLYVDQLKNDDEDFQVSSYDYLLNDQLPDLRKPKQTSK